jgi:cytochrome c
MHRVLVEIFAGLLLIASGATAGELRGHGGPVKALAVSLDGRQALSGSFDTAAINWDLAQGTAKQVLRFHDGAVNAVALLSGGRAVTSGEDARIAIWQPGDAAPETVMEGHTAPVAALAVAPDESRIASASWDGTVRLWPLAGGEPRVLEGHRQNVNGVAFTPDGRALVSVGYDAALRIWPLSGDGAPSVVTLPTPLNSVAVAPDGAIITGGSDGKVYFLSTTGDIEGEVEAGPDPVIAVAVAPDGKLIAAAGIRGAVAIIERGSRRLLRRLVGPGLPVWSAAFLPDSRALLTGGTDRVIRRWDATTGEHIGAVVTDDLADPLADWANYPGAEVFRACVACHTLSPDEGTRAGPTLAGIFGRRVATLPGYNFSPSLKGLDIIWTPETVSKLFEVGPAAYTPGTKMPEQRIGSVADRKALVEFLVEATKMN